MVAGSLSEEVVAIMVERKVAISACSLGSAALRLRLFHMSKCAFRFSLTLCLSLSVTELGV